MIRKLAFLILILIPQYVQGQEAGVQNLKLLFISKITLLELRATINESFHLTKSWVFIDKMPGSPEKNRLLEINKKVYPQYATLY